MAGRGLATVEGAAAASKGGAVCAPGGDWAAALRGVYPIAVLGPATGTDDPDLALRLLLDAARGCGLGNAPATARDGAGKDSGGGSGPCRDGEEQARAMAGTLAALRAIAPRDGIEGMLAAQMVCAHGAAIDFTGRAMDGARHVNARATYMRQAARLMALFIRQMEALEQRRDFERHPRGGLEKSRGGVERSGPVSVGSVNVEAGGQAIVGMVSGDG